jgi:uncharacterized protein (DUF1684 family)
MGDKNTSVINRNLTAQAKPVAERLIKQIGKIQTVLSAGIIALDKLSFEDRLKAIAEANGVEGAKLELYKKETDEKKLWKEVQKIAKKMNIKIDIPKDL